MEVKDEALLSDLECPVCGDYLGFPIRQCLIGHSFCGRCCNRVLHCPVCKDIIEMSRNYILESIISKLILPCKYRTSGCKVVGSVVKLRDHQEFCEHGVVVCPLNHSTKCAWSGELKDLSKHARTKHNSTTQQITNYVVSNVELNTKIFGLIEAHSEVFQYTIYMDFELNTVQVCLHFIGPREKANDYTFIIKFDDNQSCIISSSCQPMVKDCSGSCRLGSTVHMAALKETTSNGGLNFLIGIELTKKFCFSTYKRQMAHDLSVGLQPSKRMRSNKS